MLDDSSPTFVRNSHYIFKESRPYADRATKVRYTFTFPETTDGEIKEIMMINSSNTKMLFPFVEQGGPFDIDFDAGGKQLVNLGNVGIGTTSPGAKLHVYSTNGTSVIKIEDTAESGGNPQLWLRRAATD